MLDALILDKLKALIVEFLQSSIANHQLGHLAPNNLQKPWPRPKLHGIHFKIIAPIICKAHATYKQVATGRA
jgi:hypothetical protein